MRAFTTARLGSNMEVHFMQNGDPVGQVSLAVRLGIKDNQGKYKTQWISASLFGKRAESLAPYLTKGSLHAFYLRDLHIDEFTNKDGEKRVSLKAVIEDVELCGSEKSEKQQSENQKPEQKTKTVSTVDGFDDDIPF